MEKNNFQDDRSLEQIFIALGTENGTGLESLISLYACVKRVGGDQVNLGPLL